LDALGREWTSMMGRVAKTSRSFKFDEEFDRLFTDFHYTAYRLETLQRYTMPYEEEPLRRFLAGEPYPDDPTIKKWLTIVQDSVIAGKQIQRVHIVQEPLSDYIKFELEWGYPGNHKAGEEILIIPVEKGQWPDGLPKHDYWLLDSKQLIIMRYGPEGAFLTAELVDDDVEVKKHNHWRDLALDKAIPYDQYMKTYDCRHHTGM
jgi:hypothetical protein